MDKNYDFSGWATKANLLCSDGVVIRENAFEECDGKTVPLIWNHKHDDPNAVLGHAVLENTRDGVRAYGVFNDTEAGQNAKLLVQNGDINQLSIWANKLKKSGNNVIHGIIREVSLVLAGANSGARIDTVLSHSDDSCEEGIIYTGEFIEDVEPLFHADGGEKGEKAVVEETNKKDGEETVEDVFNTFTDVQKKVVYALIGKAIEDAKAEGKGDAGTEEVKHACVSGNAKKKKVIEHAKEGEEMEEMPDADGANDDETVEDVFNTLTDKQKTVVYALIGQALEEAGKKNNTNNNEGGKEMKHNVFDQETNNEEVLSHSEMMEIFEDAKRIGSMKDAFLQHGITNIDYLFPDAQTIDNVPGFIKRDDTWVTDVMNSVHKSPLSRVKSIFANITEADARARGYIKGKVKVEEVFTLLKRTTTPTTIYKKQKIDRDDVLDITGFDVVAWLKSEMRMMLNEEIARAILVGDGRSSSSDDKINEQNIRPIWTDDDVYTVKTQVPVTASTTDDQKAKSFIRACIKSRKEYKGSGNPVMYITEDMLTNCLLLEDTNGRVIYDTIEKLATALRVRKIVPVPVMENLTRIVGSNTHELAGIYVNLNDYNVGADKGGAVNMFDDFDIDYNSQKYLIETRCSGALIKPYAAVAIELVSPTNAG